MSQSILIADDDAQIRRLLRVSLEADGYKVYEAANGDEAIRVACDAPFDLVITDVLMPERDGLEMIMFLRRQAPNAKIIAISGADSGLFLENARGLGASATLAKPFSPSELLREVHGLLGPGPQHAPTPS